MYLQNKKERGEVTIANNNNIDRQLEDAIGRFFLFIGKTIVAIITGFFRGVKKLNRRSTWIGLGVAIIVMFSAYLFREKIMEMQVPAYCKWLVYVAVLLAPVIYLTVIGQGQFMAQKKYEKIFKDISFMGKDEKYPYFCGMHKDGKKLILIFKSNIPLADWKAAKGRLETALDYNILKMECGNSKKIVKLTVLPSDYKIPSMITWDDGFLQSQDGVITIGQSALETIKFNLNRVPHVLVAGETGSGKSVILRCILWQMIQKGSRVYMIDFKGGVEFGKIYEQYGEVVTERERAAEVLEMLVKENEYRLRRFRELEVKNLYEYNKKTKENLCRIGVFSDEIAEMLDKKGISKEKRMIYEEIEGKLSTLARLSRATGINLFLGVQRPDANILTGQIKNNVPVRISGRFADKSASEIVLGNTDAVDLPDIKGRFLYKVGNETIEFQSYYFDDETMLHDVVVEQGYMMTQGSPVKQKILEEQVEKPTPKKKTKKSILDKTNRPEPDFSYVPSEEEDMAELKGMFGDSTANMDFRDEEELPFALDLDFEEEKEE